MSETLDAVTAVNLYVIKGHHAAIVDGVRPTSLDVGQVGLEAYDVRDREFGLVEAAPSDDGTHLFISQRSWDEAGRPVKGREDNLLADVRTDITTNRILVASHIGNFPLPNEYDESVPKYNVRVHSSVLPEALDQGDEAADFYSELLRRSVRMFRANRSAIRWLPQQFHREGAVNRVAAADGFPLLLTSQASLDAAHDMNDMPRGSVALGQYRGSVEMDGSGSGPWGEDYKRKVKIGSAVVYIVKPSARCIVTTLDQETGARGVKGMRVLRGHNGCLVGSDKPEAFFGQNGNHVYAPGDNQRISVGDTIETLERADEPNFVKAS